MKKYKLDINKSLERFNLIQIVSVVLFVGITIFNLFMAISTSQWLMWSIIEGISIIILVTIFYTLGNPQPFLINKIKYNRMYIMGTPKKRKMIKSYISNLPLARKFKLTQLVNIQEYREDGTLYKEVPMKNGRFHGTEKIYSQSGNLKKIRSYKQDDLDGVSMDLAQNSIAIKKNYREAKLHGVSKEFDEATGNIIKKISYKNGKKDGVCKYFSPQNGQLTRKVEYKSGKKDGEETIFRKNGEIKEKREYKEDKLNGTLTLYYDSGKIKSKTEYKNDKKHGKHKEFYKNEEIKKLIHFKKGVKHGKETTYNKDGNKISETNYKDGKVKGEPKYFSSDGKKIN